jgi:hypothetical protein
MKKEEKVEQNQIISENFSKEKLEKAAGYFLGLVWAIALVMGLGFNSWVMLFVALILTFSYLLKINGISNGGSIHESSLNKHYNSSILSDHSIRPMGSDWGSSSGSNLINSPVHNYLSSNIHHRR